MKKIITYGTYDLMHYGHINLFKRAKALGDHLTVAISSDEFNKTKGKVCAMPLAQRIELLESIKYIDEIIVEKSWDQKPKDIKEHNIDIFVMGSDWKGKFDDLPCEVVYLPRTEHVSTTLLKKALNDKKNNA